MSEEPQGFGKDYSEAGFWQKLIGFATNAGREVVEIALKLFYALQSPQTPVWAKTVIYGALGYFINVFDAIPDLTPVVGYGDDFGVLVAALATVATYITPEVEDKAARKASDWFGKGEHDDAPATQDHD